MPLKVRNPVGRPRIHPRHPPASTSTIAHRSSNLDDDDIDEFDDWSVKMSNRKPDREWTNGHQDHRLSWSKKTTSTYPPLTSNAHQDRLSRLQLYPTRKTIVPYSSQSGQNTSNHAMQYSHDQPPRPKPSIARVRDKQPSSSFGRDIHFRPVLDEGLDSERGTAPSLSFTSLP